MSTQDCKKFLENVSKANNWSENSNWKRRRKYKDGNAEMREFENQHGNIVLIKEENNILSLFNAQTIQMVENKITKVENNIENVLSGLNKVNTFKSLLQTFISEKIKDYNEDMSFYKTLLEEIKNDNDWSIVENKIIKVHKDQNEYFYNVNSFVENMTYSLISHFVHENPTSKNNFFKDISSEKVKVVYDLENILAKFVEVEGTHFILLSMGGDWEFPVNAYIYYSTKNNKLKGFFPRDDGNMYNQITQTAYGSEREAAIYRKLSYDEFSKIEEEFNFEAMQDKMSSDFIEENTLLEGFKQFKEYLNKKEI